MTEVQHNLTDFLYTRGRPMRPSKRLNLDLSHSQPCISLTKQYSQILFLDWLCQVMPLLTLLRKFQICLLLHLKLMSSNALQFFFNFLRKCFTLRLQVVFVIKTNWKVRIMSPLDLSLQSLKRIFIWNLSLRTKASTYAAYKAPVEVWVLLL